MAARDPTRSQERPPRPIADSASTLVSTVAGGSELELSPEHLQRVGACCARFEQAYREALADKTPPPRIESWLDKQGEVGEPSPIREELRRQLLRTEVAILREQGGETSRQDFDQRFPAERALIASLFGEDASPACRFELKRVVSQGGAGRIYLAIDHNLQREVAVKVLRPDVADRPELILRLRQEAQITGWLQHPQIPPVYARGVLEDGSPYFAMKWIAGESLAELLKSRDSLEASRSRFVGVFGRVCEAVAYAHSKRVVHRDLKPRNVMVGRFGEVQVIDWGFGKLLVDDGLRRTASRPQGGSDTKRVDADLTLAGEVFGTPAYMSPEQAQGRVRDVDARSDVFSLGAMLCEILTGEPPYDKRASAGEIVAAAAAGRLGPCLGRLETCSAPADLVALTRRCLSVERDYRPRDAEALAAAVRKHQDDVEAQLERERVEREVAIVKVAEQQKRSRLRWMSGATLGVLLALTALAWLVRRNAVAARIRRNSSALQTIDYLIRSDQLGKAGAALGALDGGELSPANARRRDRLRHAHEAAERIDQIRLHPGDRARGELDGAEALLVQSLGFGERPDDDVVRAILASPAKSAWIALLNEWYSARVSRAAAHASESGPATDPIAERLGTMLRRADREPLHAVLRDPKSWSPDRLPALAEECSRLAMEPGIVLFLADRMDDAGVDPTDLLAAQAARRPDNFWLNFRLGRFLSRAQELESATGFGDRRESLRYFQACLALRPNDSAVLEAVATALSYDLRNFAESQRLYERAVQADPGASAAWNNYGVLLRDRADWLRDQGDSEAARAMREQAASCFRRAIVANPENAMGLINLGSHLVAEEPDKAVDLYRRAVLSKPSAGVHYRFGGLLQELGRLDEAVEQYQAGLRRPAFAWPPKSWIYNNLGETLRLRGDYAAARLNYRLAQQADEHNPWPHLNEAKLIFELGEDPQLARAMVDVVLESPQRLSNQDAAVRQAQRLLERLDRWQRTRRKLEELATTAGKVDVDSIEDRDLLLGLADAALRQGDWPRAVEVYGRAIEVADEQEALETLFDGAAAAAEVAKSPEPQARLLGETKGRDWMLRFWTISAESAASPESRSPWLGEWIAEWRLNQRFAAYRSDPEIVKIVQRVQDLVESRD